MNAAQLPSVRNQQLVEVFDLLVSDSLDRPAQSHFTGLSRINASGLPFQWSVKLDNGPGDVRFVCETGTPHSPARDRLNLSIARFYQACDVLGRRPPEAAIDAIAPRLFPADQEFPQNQNSLMWFGIGANDAGLLIKPYFNLKSKTPLDGIELKELLDIS